MNYAVTRVPGFPAWYRHDQTPRREHTERGPGKIEEAPGRPQRVSTAFSAENTEREPISLLVEILRGI